MALAIDGAAMLNSTSVQDIEIELLLEGLYQYRGDDFRGYDRTSLRRKLLRLMDALGLNTVSALQDRVLHDGETADALVRALSLRPAALFGDPDKFALLRKVLGPWLRSCAMPKVWIAECICAEDVFDLAVLLEEEGLYDKTQIFATGANEMLLQEARSSGFAAERFEQYEQNYRASGGKASLARYCAIEGARAVFAPALRRNITWAQYSLATDTSFNEFQLILCPGALTEFGTSLRRRTLRVFDESLAPFGILSVDSPGDAEATPLSIGYRTLSHEHGIYRRAG